jgi:hypothetical protein
MLKKMRLGVALQEGPFIWGFFVNEPLILL